MIGWQGLAPSQLPTPAPAAPEPARPFRSVAGRARWLYTAVAAFMIVSLASIWLELEQLSLIDSLLAGEPDSLGPVAVSRDDLEFVDLIYLLTFVVTIIAFLAWLVRAYRNLAAFGLPREHGIKGVVGWWFVPLANLVQPYRVVSETIRKSSSGRAVPTLVMYAWWASWVIGGFIGPSLLVVLFQPETYQEYRDTLLRTFLSDGATTTAGLLLVWLVWWTTRAQEDRSLSGSRRATDPISEAETGTGRARWALGSVVALGLVAFALISTVTSDSVGPTRSDDLTETAEGAVPTSRVATYDLKIGDCFTDGITDIIWTMTLVDCAEPHEGEVFAQFRHAGGRSDAFPGDADLWDYAWDGCLPRFDDAIGEAYETSPLEIYYIVPDRLSWSVNDREISCLVVHFEGDRLEGSDRNGAAPSPGVIPPTGREPAKV